MNTIEALKNNIEIVNKTLQVSIEDKSLFDDCFKESIIRIKTQNCQPPTYKKRSILCPVYQKSFDYDVTKRFSKSDFNSFKKTVNNCILLDALGNLMIYNKLLTEGFNNSDNIYNKIFKTFAHKKNYKSTKLFMKSVRECNASIRIFIINVLVQNFHYTNDIKYMVRVGTEFKFKNE